MSLAVEHSEKPEFVSWTSYIDFVRRVTKTRRYVWDAEVRSFLETVLRTRMGRGLEILLGTIWWRAQLEPTTDQFMIRLTAKHK